MPLDNFSSKIAVFCLHYLGGSGREWEAVANLAVPIQSFVQIDLQGFGEAAESGGYTVNDMALKVLQITQHSAAKEWVLVGHSMGAKVAMAVARSVEDQQSPPKLLGLVLIAGSPPSPEPIDEDRREKMKSWFLGDAESNYAEAKYYIEQNVAKNLPPAREDQAIEDVLRMNREAWLAWLDHGSREDWSDRIGILKTPALLIAGSEDNDLGAGAQSRLTMPHLANARLVTIPGAKHLLPLEAPDQVAALIVSHVGSIQAFRQ